MSKGAAKEDRLGGIHGLLATVFEKTLQKYLSELEILEDFNTEEMEEELVAAVMQIPEPNPAMLSAVAKFLKDNDIGMDSDEVDTLNSTQRRLEEAAKRRRASPLNLAAVPHVANG